jgi:hypothetical protein
VPGNVELYRTYVFGFAVQDFPIQSWAAFVIFHGLVWSSFLVIAGVMVAFRRRMIDHGAVAVQQFEQEILPLLLLFSISVTGLMLTASYTWMKGYAYDFLAILHAITVIVTLLWLPFGKLLPGHMDSHPACDPSEDLRDLDQLRPAFAMHPCELAGMGGQDRNRGAHVAVMAGDDPIDHRFERPVGDARFQVVCIVAVNRVQFGGHSRGRDAPLATGFVKRALPSAAEVEAVALEYRRRPVVLCHDLADGVRGRVLNHALCAPPGLRPVIVVEPNGLRGGSSTRI